MLKASKPVVLMFDKLRLLEIPLMFGLLLKAVFFQRFIAKQEYVPWHIFTKHVYKSWHCKMIQSKTIFFLEQVILLGHKIL